jgi:ribokinase
MDLVTSTTQIPKVGETVLGNSFHSIPGGKGANQAVAAARLGADVTMIAAVGNDSFGKTLVEHLTNEGINTENIIKVKDTSTGIASIIVSEADNSIIVVPGANNHVTPDVIDKHGDKIINSDIILLQLEIRTILNPAPIQKLPKELLEMVDYLTPNEHEQALLFDSIGGTEEELAKYKEKCIVTKGSKGVMIYKNGEKNEIPSIQVEAVDTTGAGDSFNGALAVALCDGLDIEEACRFANVVGAISVTKLGAQTGMPTKKEVEEFMHLHKSS